MLEGVAHTGSHTHSPQAELKPPLHLALVTVQPLSQLRGGVGGRSEEGEVGVRQVPLLAT